MRTEHSVLWIATAGVCTHDSEDSGGACTADHTGLNLFSVGSAAFKA